ncbi:MAG: hypothetical protein WA303_06025 [Bradyrhizobium sp.]|jgi:hypothetical protein
MASVPSYSKDTLGDDFRALFFTERGKTGVPVGGIRSARSMRILAAHLEKRGATPIRRQGTAAPTD